MGSLADELKAKLGATSPRREIEIKGADAKGVIQDGGSVRVPMGATLRDGLKDAPKPSAPRVTIRDAQSIADAQAIRDAAYSDYLSSIAAHERRALSLPTFIDAYDVPKVLTAFSDASDPANASRARAGIEQLRAVEMTCRARAETCERPEERRAAEQAAEYLAGLASVSELILSGKIEKTPDPALRTV